MSHNGAPKIQRLSGRLQELTNRESRLLSMVLCCLTESSCLTLRSIDHIMHLVFAYKSKTKWRIMKPSGQNVAAATCEKWS